MSDPDRIQRIAARVISWEHDARYLGADVVAEIRELAHAAYQFAIDVNNLTVEVARRRTADQIDGFIARAVDAALGEVARQQSGIAEPTATEARNAGITASAHLYRLRGPAASHATVAIGAPEDATTAVEWVDDDGFVTARFGSLSLEILNLAEGGWAWSVIIGGYRQAHGGDMTTTLDAAKTAAIAAARAWRDSIRL